MPKKKPSTKAEEFAYPLAEVRGMYGALKALAQVPLSARLGYGIAQAAREFEGHVKLYEEQIKVLGRKYDAVFGDFDFKVPDDNKPAFNKEAKDLLETEVTVTVRPIVLPPECELPAAILMDLDDFVSVRGIEAPEPRKPNPIDPETGKPMSDGKMAQDAADETTAKQEATAE